MNDHTVSVDSEFPLPDSVTQSRLTSLIAHILAEENINQPWELGIRFVDDATMQAAHAEFMGIDEPTDIMTFPAAHDDDLWGDSEPGGDLIISIDTARDNAKAAGWTLDDELYFLVAHGMLHLLGWDDHSQDGREAMLQHQHHLIETWAERP